MKNMAFSYNTWASLNGRSTRVNTTNGTWRLDWVPVVKGTNTLTVSMRDVSGNVATQSVTFTKTNIVNGRFITWDPNGNPTNIVSGTSKLVLSYDMENRLTQVTSNGISILQNWYDGMGRRIAKQEVVSGVTNKYLYVYSGWTVLAVLNGTNSQPLEIYTRGAGIGGDIGSIVAVTHYAGSFTNGTFYYHNNHRGDVTCVRSGTVTVATYDYKAYGELRSSSGTYTSRYRFSSKEYDASMGIYYYGFRFYRPETGTWLTQDPLKEGGGLNQFRFARNNPVNFIDPSGAVPKWVNDYSYSSVGRQFTSIGDAFGSGVAGYWGWFTMDNNLTAAAGQLLQNSANNSGWAILDEECAGTGARAAYGGALALSAAATSIAVGHAVVGEIGAKAFSNSQWPKMGLEGLSNFDKGMKLIKSQGLLRALLPTAKGMALGLGSGAFAEGPTAAAIIGGIPAVATGGRYVYGAWKESFGK